MGGVTAYSAMSVKIGPAFFVHLQAISHLRRSKFPTKYALQTYKKLNKPSQESKFEKPDIFWSQKLFALA